MASKRDLLLIVGALVIFTLVVFWGVHGYGFINLDDNGYITENARVQGGLTLEDIAWAFKTTDQCFWHPLVWLSYFFDRSIFGTGPVGFHVTSLFLHILNTILLFLLLQKMTSSTWRSAFVAFLFAVHPLHVESVAWISQRKDVLSTLFGLLAIYAYVRYCEVEDSPIGKRASAYGLVVLLFILGLMSKPMLVTLPFVLLLLDYWPLKRIGTEVHDARKAHLFKMGKVVCWLVYEKVPLFVISIVFSIIAYMAQRAGGAVSTTGSLPIAYRLGNAIVSCAVYVLKMLWPRNLAVYYPHPGASLSFLQVLLAGLFIIGISALVFLAHSIRRYLLLGWLWYIVTLIPVIGLIQVGGHGMADRYTYVPIIGLFIAISWFVADFFVCRRERWTAARSRKALSPVLSLSAVIVVLSLGICTNIQCRYWRDSIALFKRALAVTKNNYTAHLNLGMALEVNNKVEQAVKHYQRALEIEPRQWKVWNGLGIALERLGQDRQAMDAYKRAIELSPNSPEPHGNIAMLLARGGRFEEAEKHASIVIHLCPEDTLAHNLMGKILTDLGRFTQAEAEFRRGIQLQPEFADNHFQLALLLKTEGRIHESIMELENTLRAEPSHPQAHLELVHARCQAGDYNGARREIEECQRLGIEVPPDLLDRLFQQASDVNLH